MPSMHSKGPEDRKASSLTDSSRIHGFGRPEAGGGTASRKGDITDRPVRRTANRSWVVALVTDLLLILFLVGLGVGGYFGYCYVRDLYAPSWDTREVVFGVEMTGINPDMVRYGQDGRPTFTGNAIWSSDRTDADLLGTVTDVRTVLVTHEDGTNTLNLYLTVTANARYREGKGYWMGNTHLLAGMEGTFRLEGMSAAGRIISMHETADESESVTEAGTVWAEPGEVDPDAQG